MGQCDLGRWPGPPSEFSELERHHTGDILGTLPHVERLAKRGRFCV